MSKQTFHDIKVGDTVWLENNSAAYSRSPKPLDRLRAAIGRAEVFLRGYPYATDEQVTAYCIANVEDVALIVPGNRTTVLARLITDGLKDREQAA